MRYFYYGTDHERQYKAAGTDIGSTDGWDGDLIIDEDTVYEIDRECEKCRKRMQDRYTSQNQETAVLYILQKGKTSVLPSDM